LASLLGKQGGPVLLPGSGGERFSALLTRAKTVLQEGLTRAKTVSSSFCTRLRVPPLARWTVRERVRTSGYFWPHAMPSMAHAALGTSCSVACVPLLAILQEG